MGGPWRQMGACRSCALPTHLDVDSGIIPDRSTDDAEAPSAAMNGLDGGDGCEPRGGRVRKN